MLIQPNPSSTTLYASHSGLESHAVRFIMAIKSIEGDVENIEIDEMPDEILELNPCQSLPTLFDRGTVLYDLAIMLEYLDERFPFPPLLPVDPIEKSEKRQLVFRFTRMQGCWYQLVKTIETGSKTASTKARRALTNSLIELIPLFSYRPYFKSDSITLVDACLAPILWRLPHLGIVLDKKASPINAYANRLFSFESFQQSLTDCEKEYRA